MDYSNIKTQGCIHPEMPHCLGCEWSIRPEFYDGGCRIVYPEEWEKLHGRSQEKEGSS